MIIKPELVKRIKEYFNLNIYETKVWLALLSKGIASAGEIAEISNVPRSRTYDVLESLEKMGFAIVKIGKPVKYIAIKPNEVVEKIKNKTLFDAQERVKSLADLKDTQEYTELEQLHNSGIAPIRSNDITGSLKGRANIVSRVRELLENASKEVVICTSVLDFDDKSRVLIPSLEKLLKNNVKIKISLSGDQEKIKKVSNRIGIKIKPTESKARVFIADRKEIIFMITPDNADEEMGVWLQSPFFTESLSSIMDQALKQQFEKN
ncbi:MAG TPA: helix-turn-helix domain-containing protein [Candidatus Nanoarchaeia archaeon]|nr:helix-turn-helix domain-containing protein [Candidatus Nanoarchaeia archaeon]